MTRAHPARAALVVVVAAAMALVTMASTASATSRQTGDEHPSDVARPDRPEGCRRASLPSGVTDRTVVSGGIVRHYQLTIPPGYTGRKPLPVVLGFHALTVPYQFVASQVGFADMEARYDFIGVAPSGLLDHGTPYWLAAPVRPNYDLRFVDDLLDRLEHDLCVDTSRIYATGMSNGAQMSSLLACRMSNRIAAVAPVAGAEFYPRCHGRPVPVIAFHGTADPIVTYDGGGLNSVRIADIDFWKGNDPKDLPVDRGLDVSMQRWAEHNGCDGEPVETRIAPEVRLRTWRDCRAETAFYIVDGGGHAWPGKPVPGFENLFGHTTTEIDASTLIFRFLFAQRLHTTHDDR